jgi:hypothetical protein
LGNRDCFDFLRRNVFIIHIFFNFGSCNAQKTSNSFVRDEIKETAATWNSCDKTKSYTEGITFSYVVTPCWTDLCLHNFLQYDLLNWIT